LGTGFVISNEGLIATNLHVIGRGHRLQVETSDAKIYEVEEVHASDIDLDLAILRVKAAGLKALVLGDSAKVVQGESIVAMGNPQGLTFSVVEGVVSAIRKLEDMPLPMIQVAMPIERGNSGGPIVDRQQRVLGILTLKSMKTDNLGFATPVNALKKLLEQPNPVPMANWLSIDTFDNKVWKPVMGAHWTQQAGIMNVEELGEGFGGRALCLWLPDEPKSDSFEVSVSVRLNDESGAAGLAFCSDEGDAHYGFYPTGGRLRLTRFEGPNVSDWTILKDQESEAYHPGEWNQLRVRVEKDRVLCFLNGEQVIEIADTGLRGGRVGLCKFRQTKAEYRKFHWGTDLADKPIPAEVLGKLGKAIASYLAKPGRPPSSDLATDPALARKLIDERIKKLETQAAALRTLATDLHRQHIAQELAAELQKPEDKISLLTTAMLISRHDNPELDPEPYVSAVQRMVDDLHNDADIKAGSSSKATARISRYLFKENGFHGTRSFDYDNKSNSYINEVLDDRDGLPITLSVLYLELAERLGLKDVFGISVPTHFMVGYRADKAIHLVDVFDGGKEIPLPQSLEGGENEAIKAAPKKDIVVRMITNLMTRSEETKAGIERFRHYRDLILAAAPDNISQRSQRLEDRLRSGDKAGARVDAKWLLEHPPEGVSEDGLQQLGQLYQDLGKE
jgi:regulator of sirC expression with transglutaminase-like and TPR domain